MVPSSDPIYSREPFFEGFDTQSAFDFYEASRHRLPAASYPEQARHASGLVEMAEHCDVFCFDAFGVLNVGGTPIPGAVDTVKALRGLGKQLFVITNAATLPKAQAVAKFERLGFDFSTDEIVTSRMAAEEALAAHPDHLWGVMARSDFKPDDVPVRSILLTHDIATYDAADAFLFLSTWEWTSEQTRLLEVSLAQNMRPIMVANPDVIAPLEEAFSTESGFVAHRIADLLGVRIEFHGKPFPSVFDLVQRVLPAEQNRRRICMIGDTLHTDVLGGAQAGWSTVLVADHGLFRGHDPAQFINESGIVPNWIVPSI
ncbi:hydrolase [Ahrensia sp. R2A130]|nr:hydrolase [Ahrensia sp. R2A130]